MDRFWSKVDKSGGPCACWPWTAGRFSRGYGAFAIGGKVRGAHVVALEQHTGEPADGRQARHSCDNPPCCNPEHLSWGSNQDNVADRTARGRGRTLRGEDHPNARLTQEQVVMVRARYIPYDKHHSAAAIARDLGVSAQNIRDIVNDQRRTCG